LPSLRPCTEIEAEPRFRQRDTGLQFVRWLRGRERDGTRCVDRRGDGGIQCLACVQLEPHENLKVCDRADGPFFSVVEAQDLRLDMQVVSP
jgi:hypothetical protein